MSLIHPEFGDIYKLDFKDLSFLERRLHIETERRMEAIAWRDKMRNERHNMLYVKQTAVRCMMQGVDFPSQPDTLYGSTQEETRSIGGDEEAPMEEIPDSERRSDAPSVPTKDMAKAAQWVFDNMHSRVTEKDAPSSGAWSLLVWAREATDKFHAQYGMLLAKTGAADEAKAAQDKVAAKMFEDDEAKLREMEDRLRT